MKILIAPDSFKESMSSEEVANRIRKGIEKVSDQETIVCLPIADGGEGTVRSLVDFTGGKIVDVVVHDPLMRKVNSFYGILGDGKTAVIEVAAASGLALLSKEERNPLHTTSYGTGELILHAISSGYRDIIIGLGGSAVNDGGAGILEALGAKLFTLEGKEITKGGQDLNTLKEIQLSHLDPRLKDCHFQVACDVSNPLVGDQGASEVFGPQKGATPEMVKMLDQGLLHYGTLLESISGHKVVDVPGAGAAGGIAATLMAFFSPQLKSGFDLIAETVGLKELIKHSDLVITGEGKVDRQTQSGKVPLGVARIGKQYGKKVFVFAGMIGEGADFLYKEGVSALIPICRSPMTVEESIQNGGELLELAAEMTFRVFLAGKHS